MPTVLQSGDPNVLFKHHTCCKDYGVRYASLYCKITALIIAATCLPHLHKFTSKWIATGTSIGAATHLGRVIWRCLLTAFAK